MEETAGTPRLKRSFPPVADRRARLLVLGSLPGEVSLAQGRYYAHPQNQFWRLMGRVLATPLAELPYAERLEALVRAKVALWDVIASAERSGSLDSGIRGHTPHPLADFLATLPELRAVAFNGSTAWTLGRRAIGDPSEVRLIRLPSSSAANATLPFDAKAEAWTQLKVVLAPP